MIIILCITSCLPLLTVKNVILASIALKQVFEQTVLLDELSLMIEFLSKWLYLLWSMQTWRLKRRDQVLDFLTSLQCLDCLHNSYTGGSGSICVFTQEW